MKTVNLVKLSVGIDSIEHLQSYRERLLQQGGPAHPRHITRMWPRREAEILNGGSIYWVIKGLICCRQKVLRLEEVMGEDGIRRCAIVMDPQIIRTQTAVRRPFQGWRYLPVEDSPADLDGQGDQQQLPNELMTALAEIGVR
ncbi:MAG: lysophospholipase [Rhodobacterales bacterium]|nr:MAG: lysophospholipase [Rhodobacterales bacterium]